MDLCAGDRVLNGRTALSLLRGFADKTPFRFGPCMTQSEKALGAVRAQQEMQGADGALALSLQAPKIHQNPKSTPVPWRLLQFPPHPPCCSHGEGADQSSKHTSQRQERPNDTFPGTGMVMGSDN